MGAGAGGVSCELKETCAEYVCCFIWQAAYKRKGNHVDVKERGKKSIAERRDAAIKIVTGSKTVFGGTRLLREEARES